MSGHNFATPNSQRIISEIIACVKFGQARTVIGISQELRMPQPTVARYMTQICKMGQAYVSDKLIDRIGNKNAAIRFVYSVGPVPKGFIMGVNGRPPVMPKARSKRDRKTHSPVLHGMPVILRTKASEKQGVPRNELECFLFGRAA